jgi:hypothetical protein
MFSGQWRRHFIGQAKDFAKDVVKIWEKHENFLRTKIKHVSPPWLLQSKGRGQNFGELRSGPHDMGPPRG